MSADSASYATKLEQWLALAPVKVADVARQAGITPEHLRNIARGIRGTSYEKAERISTATGGVVAISDIIGKDARFLINMRRAKSRRETA